MDRPPALDPNLVNEFVAVAHGSLERVTALLDAEPGLLNAAWDWGGGDFETGLGAASHVGRRDIALFLLQRGARMDIFAAAMLGEVEIVRAILTAFPAARTSSGAHGIPLIVHAQQGGAQAEGVVALLNGE
ncbi:MAG: ankyrin repeat domain-containing protein [Chloroflexi bacterium]|nr:MAG: ankyrin repeat domain-containing protein [Chloroflexota bacterium]